MKKYKKPNKSIIDVFANFPWFINLLIGIIILYVPYHFKSKILTSNILFLNQNYNFIYYICIIFSSVFFILALVSIYKKRQENILVLREKNIKSLYRLSWQDFETLTRQVFNKKGYKVKAKGGNKADGGIDVEAYKNGSKTIIQCKQWKSSKVGVSVVREMYGVMIHEKASEVYILTCGSFTKDAKLFAKGKPIHLIHGFKILEWIDELN